MVMQKWLHFGPRCGPRSPLGTLGVADAPGQSKKRFGSQLRAPDALGTHFRALLGQIVGSGLALEALAEHFGVMLAQFGRLSVLGLISDF